MGRVPLLDDRALPLRLVDMAVIMDDAERGSGHLVFCSWSPLERGAAYGKPPFPS